VIESYLTDTVTLIAPPTLSTTGRVTATGDESTVAARVDNRTRLVRNVAGEQVVSSARVLLSDATAITHKYKIRVSGVDREILAINVRQDFTARFKEVFLA